MAPAAKRKRPATVVVAARPGRRAAISTRWVVPGKGLGKVRIGANIAEVIKLLGKPLRQTGYAPERASWQKDGYEPDKQLMFVLGFDTMYEFTQVSTSPYYPVWKVYVLKGKTVFLTLTTFSTTKSITEKMGLSPGCRFYDDVKQMITELGKNYIYRAKKGGSKSHYYLRRGINVITDNGKIRVFEIFPPLSKSLARAYVGILSSPSTPP